MKKAQAQTLKTKPAAPPAGGAPGFGLTPGAISGPTPGAEPTPGPTPRPGPGPDSDPTPTPSTAPVRVKGTIPPELWNRLGTKVLPKLRTLNDFEISVTLSASAEASGANELRGELRQIIEDLGLTDAVTVD